MSSGPSSHPQTRSRGPPRPPRGEAIDVEQALRATRIPESLFNVDSLAAWCPKCFQGDQVIPVLQDLPGYLTILDRLYHSAVFLEPNHPATQPLRLAGDHRVFATIERHPYLALLFSVRSRQ